MREEPSSPIYVLFEALSPKMHPDRRGVHRGMVCHTIVPQEPPIAEQTRDSPTRHRRGLGARDCVSAWQNHVPTYLSHAHLALSEAVSEGQESSVCMPCDRIEHFSGPEMIATSPRCLGDLWGWRKNGQRIFGGKSQPRFFMFPARAVSAGNMSDSVVSPTFWKPGMLASCRACDPILRYRQTLIRQ